ncbi:hypothetical protein A5667_15680 [Mycolicibacterium fortuitum]|nr:MULTISPECIES: hypothetical protein [Mycolicibacterium]OBA94574.1 hypothetical protein A5665_06845 [Mycolicibacterium fortuitum]OBB08253.1 hypothetical protein A5668_13495 [Mycolicibacterium fortuitum]OBG43819.1 hypothetical protein A5670_12985 [Mycolicibacterium fortuitum]OBI58487.1 hypothetical protein A5666_18880 [Mycolicibacterium fortuitum]OBI59591.1 hypothetical protein A5667_15680 [Mycolicibacterium fortuitum]
MRSMWRPVLLGLAGLTVPIAVAAAPPAAADCVDAGGSTVCAQGNVRGGGPTPPKAGPYYPYYCANDWYCGDWGLDINIDPGPPNGGGGGGGWRPDRPGRP